MNKIIKFSELKLAQKISTFLESVTDTRNFENPFQDTEASYSTYRDGATCFIHGYPLYLTFLLPIGVMLAFNVFVFFKVMNSVFNKKEEVSFCVRDTGSIILFRLPLCSTVFSLLEL